jgi:hypothetical protein
VPALHVLPIVQALLSETIPASNADDINLYADNVISIGLILQLEKGSEEILGSAFFSGFHWRICTHGVDELPLCLSLEKRVVAAILRLRGVKFWQVNYPGE